MKHLAGFGSLVNPTDFSHTGIGVVVEGPGGVGVVVGGAPERQPVIGMYVRRDDTSDPKVKARTISLRPIPDRASIDDLLQMGFAFDGDTVTLGVTPGVGMIWTRADGKRSDKDDPQAYPVACYDNEEPWTLSESLNRVQRDLVAWLRRLGYEVKIS